MTSLLITRRHWLFGACCAGLGIASGVAAETTGLGAINTEPYPGNADEALTRLKNGNQRFMDDNSRHNHEKASWRSLLVGTQKPVVPTNQCRLFFINELPE